MTKWDKCKHVTMRKIFV